MQDFIICPNCGEKINIRTMKILNAPFFKYMICPVCKEKLTKLTNSTFAFIKLFEIFRLIMIIFVIFLTIISFYNNVDSVDDNAHYTVFQGICLALLFITFILLISIVLINDILSRINIKKSRNGFLPTINGLCSNKYVTYLKEESVSKYKISEKLGTLKPYRKNFDVDMNKYIILLPRTDITVKICKNNMRNINLINLYDVYKANNDEIYLLLSDYQVDFDIKLEFKNLSKFDFTTFRCDCFELFTSNGEYIGKASLTQA